MSPIPTVSKMCVGLREGRSVRGGPHILPSSLFFINHNLCVGSGVRTFSAPLCAYASFINETPELSNKLEAFTCVLYAPKASTTMINKLRYHIFCAKKGEIESHQLPPCKDSLRQHTLRANYQAGIWRICLEKDPQVPSPVGRGWRQRRKVNSLCCTGWKAST